MKMTIYTPEEGRALDARLTREAIASWPIEIAKMKSRLRKLRAKARLRKKVLTIKVKKF